MRLTTLDWIIVAVSIGLSFVPALWMARRAGSSTAEFFTSGRAAPWWLIGVSMVATTFSTDTPNLVTNLVREGGIASNWAWWAFLLTGMTTVFFYARLWRRLGRADRSGVLRTPLFRPGGHVGARVPRRLPGRAVQRRDHGVGESGRRQDRQRAARVAHRPDAAGLWRHQHRVCRDVGSVGRARHRLHPVRHRHGRLHYRRRLRASPSGGRRSRGALLAQSTQRHWRSCPTCPTGRWPCRSSSCRSPCNGGRRGIRGPSPAAAAMSRSGCSRRRASATPWRARCSSTWRNYALRPWPWIIVALASMLVFPEIADIRRALPQVDPALVGHDMAYSAMLTFLPARRAGRDGGRVARGLRLDHLDAPQLGHLVSRARPLSPLLESQRRRAPLRESRPPRDRRADDCRRAADARARVGPRHLQSAVVDRRRHGPAVSAALVLVADQRVERDCRHGQLVRAGRGARRAPAPGRRHSVACSARRLLWRLRRWCGSPPRG